MTPTSSVINLFIVVKSQKLTNRFKGKTVCNEVERYDAVRHCRYVDEVIIDSPWLTTPEFIEKYQVRYCIALY